MGWKEGRGIEQEGPGGPRNRREGERANKAPVQSASTARLKNKLLRVSCLACSIFGGRDTRDTRSEIVRIGRQIRRDHAGPRRRDGDASNGDVRGGRENLKRGSGSGGEEENRTGEQKEERGHMKEEEDDRRDYKVVPPGEKTAVVFPSEVEDEDERDRSLKSDREGRGGADS